MDATPRIKKQVAENVKLLRAKFDNLEDFRSLLAFAITGADETEKEKTEGGTEKQIQQLMDIFAVKASKAPPKKDFRAFLKQQKAVGTNLKSQDGIAGGEKQE